jgi:hypothetical protein
MGTPPRNVRGRAVAGDAGIDLARIGLGINEQLAEILCRQRWPGDVDVRGLRNQDNRHEILLRIERQSLRHELVERDRPRRREQDRIAVGRRLGGRGSSDIAGGAGPVVNHDLLAELLGELDAERSRQHVGGAAGRERHDHGDGT